MHMISHVCAVDLHSSTNADAGVRVCVCGCLLVRGCMHFHENEYRILYPSVAEARAKGFVGNNRQQPIIECRQKRKYGCMLVCIYTQAGVLWAQGRGAGVAGPSGGAALSCTSPGTAIPPSTRSGTPKRTACCVQQVMRESPPSLSLREENARSTAQHSMGPT